MTQPALSEEDRAEVLGLEEAMWRAATRFDVAFQESRFAADFVEFGRSGRIYARSDAIRADGRPIHAATPLRNVSVRALDVDTVQVTYDSEVDYDGVVEHARRSSIWSRTPQGWVMRFHQGTPCEPSTLPRPVGGSTSLRSIEAKAFVPARDFDTSKRFYQDIGFALVWSTDELACFRHDRSTFLLENFCVEEHVRNFKMHLLVERVDDWWRAIRDRGILERYHVSAEPPADRPWGLRDFVLVDPAGVMWRIGSRPAS